MENLTGIQAPVTKSLALRGLLNVKAWASVYHRPAYKTAIPEGDIYFYIVTRVNYLTASLWMQYRNAKVNDRRKGFVELPVDKPNWLVMTRNFRRMQDKKMRVLDYLEERKNRVTAAGCSRKDNVL